MRTTMTFSLSMGEAVIASATKKLADWRKGQ